MFPAYLNGALSRSRPDPTASDTWLGDVPAVGSRAGALTTFIYPRQHHRLVPITSSVDHPGWTFLHSSLEVQRINNGNNGNATFIIHRPSSEHENDVLARTYIHVEQKLSESSAPLFETNC